MLNRLKSKYSYAIPKDFNTIPLPFRLTVTDSEGTSMTFDKRKLTEDEATILDTLFNEEQSVIANGKSPVELALSNWLIQEQEVNRSLLEKKLVFPFRFVHFSIKGALGDYEEFEEAMKSFFPTSAALIWKNKFEGILLQSIDCDFEEEGEDDSISDTITSDFYVQISLYVGSPITTFDGILKQFHWESASFHIARNISPTKRMFLEYEIVPYFLLTDLTDETKKTILEMIEPVLDEQTLLESVKVYLECNMNTTLAAKKLFMHRNTLQYRVDKFIEKTSIDIKRFPNAVAVYLMFVLLQHKRDH